MTEESYPLQGIRVSEALSSGTSCLIFSRYIRILKFRYEKSDAACNVFTPARLSGYGEHQWKAKKSAKLLILNILDRSNCEKPEIWETMKAMMRRKTTWIGVLGFCFGFASISMGQTLDSSPRNWLAPTSITEATVIPPNICTVQDKLTADQAQYRNSWFTSCQHISPSANRFLTMQISPDTLEWQNIPAGSYNYPTFLLGTQVWVPNLASCSIPTQVKWVHVCNTLVPITPTRVGSEILYDGEIKPFTIAQAWDPSASTITESIVAPASGRRHLRVMLNNQDYWGAAAYVFKDYSHRDLSIHRKFTFKAKASQKPLKLKIYFVSMDDGIESEWAEVNLENTYKIYEIDLSSLRNSGFNFSRVQAVIFAISEQDTKQFLIDIDDIKVFI